MSWTYIQSTGELKHNGKVVATGYSGAGAGKNNPTMQHMVQVGPIPKGRYRINNPENTEHHGPHAMRLEPLGHNALGRSAFMIHGDSRKHPGTASQGCIILPRTVRERISGSGDPVLVVISHDSVTPTKKK